MCELPLPMTGTILSTILCSLGQRSLGASTSWVGGCGWARGERRHRENEEEPLQFEDMLEQGQGMEEPCSPGDLG